MRQQRKHKQGTNLAPLERVLSIAGGALLIRKGLMVKGIFGLADIAAGALGVYRGVTGFCPAKQRMAASTPAAALKRLPSPTKLIGALSP